MKSWICAEIQNTLTPDDDSLKVVQFFADGILSVHGLGAGSFYQLGDHPILSLYPLQTLLQLSDLHPELLLWGNDVTQRAHAM